MGSPVSSPGLAVSDNKAESAAMVASIHQTGGMTEVIPHDIPVFFGVAQTQGKDQSLLEPVGSANYPATKG